MNNEPPATGPQEEPVFDHNRALAMLADDVDLLFEVIETFLKHAPVQIEELEAAIGVNDDREIERLAHGLKGAAVNVHALRIRQKAAEVEASAQAKDREAVVAQAGELRAEMTRFKSHLASFDWQSLRGAP